MRPFRAVLIICGLLLCGLLLVYCEKSEPAGPLKVAEAKGKAEAEYRCDNVGLLRRSGDYVKLNVCGKTIWYRCLGGYSVECFEVEKKK